MDKDFDTNKWRDEFKSNKDWESYIIQVAKYIYKLLFWKDLDE